MIGIRLFGLCGVLGALLLGCSSTTDQSRTVAEVRGILSGCQPTDPGNPPARAIELQGRFHPEGVVVLVDIAVTPSAHLQEDRRAFALSVMDLATPWNVSVDTSFEELNTYVYWNLIEAKQAGAVCELCPRSGHATIGGGECAIYLLD